MANATSFTNVVALPGNTISRRDSASNSADADDTASSKRVDVADDAVLVHAPVRAQLRIPLSSLDQAEVDLELLLSAAERSLSQIRRAKRHGDQAALLAVRGILARCNSMVNGRRQGR